MQTLELTVDEQRRCQEDRFCAFIRQSEIFSPEETSHLQSVIINKQLSSIMYVSSTLAVWSMIAGWVDAVILPAVVAYTIAMPGAKFYPVLFPVVFTLVNALFKFIFIRRRLKNAIKLYDNLLAVIPYIGAAFLLKNWFINEPLLKRASLAYLNHQKAQVMRKLMALIKLQK